MPDGPPSNNPLLPGSTAVGGIAPQFLQPMLKRRQHGINVFKLYRGW